MKARLFTVLTIVVSLAFALTGGVTAQGTEPPGPHPWPLPRSQPPEEHGGRHARTGEGSDSLPLSGSFPTGEGLGMGAQGTLLLGQPGLSFRYVQTFGVTEQPYFSDTVHINRPLGLFMDGSNNPYVTEEQGNRMLRYNSVASNTLVIGKAGVGYTDDYMLNSPQDVALDSGGNIWVADSNRIVQYDVNGVFLQQLPATEPWVSGSDNSHFNDIHGVAFDGAGRLFVSDTQNHRIQVYELISNTLTYSTTIGTTGVSGNSNSQFNSPYRLAVDSANRLYVVDEGNNRVQRCTFSSAWTCSTFDSGLNNPQGITIDSSNNVFIADTSNGRIRKCSPAGVCSDFVTNTYWFYDVAVDSSGNVYGSAAYEDIVVKYNSSGGLMGTFLGVEFVPYLTDSYHYNHPRVAIDSSDNIVVVEENGQRLIKLNSAGTALWAVGVPGVDANDNAHFNYPHGVAVDKDGNIYVADGTRVQIFTGNGVYSATLGTGYGTGNYQFAWATGIAVDGNGNIYVSDGSNHRVQIYNNNRVYVATLGVTGVPGSDNSHFNYPIGIEIDSMGNIYVADIANCRVQKFNSSRAYQMTFGTTGSCTNSFSDVSAEDVTVDSQGRVYISGWNDRVQVFDGTGAYLTTLGGAWGSNIGQFRGVGGVAVDSAGNVYAADFTFNARIQKFSPGVPGWRQSNINGFGDPQNSMIPSLASFAGQLYASTYNPDSGNGSQLWRTSDGIAWTSVMTNGFGNAANVGIDHLMEFNGNFYAGTWANEVNGGEVWRSGNGLNWTRVISQGFGDPTNGEIYRFAVFNNQIYATTWSYTTTHGVEIWRSSTGNSGDWTQVVSNGLDGDTNNVSVPGFEEFNGYLYAGTRNNTTGGEVWRSSTGNAGDWTRVNTDGFGTANNRGISALAAFKGYLYAGTRGVDNIAGTQVWRCQICDGTDWTKVVDNGFGNVNTYRNPALEVFDGRLYLVVGNLSTGIEVWRTLNGVNWEQVGFAGFGDSNNSMPLWDNSVVVFNNSLYIGTINFANGGEVWQLLRSLYLPLIQR